MPNKEKYLKKLKELYRKKENIELSDNEALAHFEKLNVLVEAVYKPVSKKFFEDATCPVCKQPVNFESFADSLSEKEFLISGLCQNCQNKTFQYGK